MREQISFGAILVQLGMLLHKSVCMCVIWKKNCVWVEMHSRMYTFLYLHVYGTI